MDGLLHRIGFAVVGARENDMIFAGLPKPYTIANRGTVRCLVQLRVVIDGSVLILFYIILRTQMGLKAQISVMDDCNIIAEELFLSLKK